MSSPVELPRHEALQILAALDTFAQLAADTGNLTAEVEAVDALATLTLRLFGDLPDQGDTPK